MFQIIKAKNMFFLFVISLIKSYMSKQYYSRINKKVYVVWAAKVFNSKQDHKDV